MQKMINFVDVTKENKEHNSNWLQIVDHPMQNINNWSFWIWKNKFII